MQDAYSPGHREQIVPVHTLVLPDLVVRADAARVDHDAPVGVRLGVEQVVAFRAEVEGSLCCRLSEVNESERGKFGVSRSTP